MAQKSDVIRSDIEETRAQMGDTLDALGYKANVPARTRGWVASKRDAVTGAAGSAVTRISGATDSMISRVTDAAPTGGDLQAGAGRLKHTAERNPLGVALVGAAAGFAVGILAPSTGVEDEKLGPMADEVKAQAVDAGQEAIERGKQVAASAAQSAVETAKEEGRQQGEELTSSLQEKAREVVPGSPSP
jgi:gas vesicle protein